MNQVIADYPILAEIPVVMKTEEENGNGALKAWRIWDSLRMACDHKLRLLCVLRLGASVPLEYDEDYNRWTGEPVHSIVIADECWTMNRAGYPCLLKAHQNFIRKFVHMDPILIVETKGYNEDLHLRVAYLKNGLWPNLAKTFKDVNGTRANAEIALLDFLQSKSLTNSTILTVTVIIFSSEFY